MLVFDAVILNEDRHFGNFGLLVDSHTNKIIAPAPIFDNGLSFEITDKEQIKIDFQNLYLLIFNSRL